MNNQITQLERRRSIFLIFGKIDFEARFGIYAKNAAERSRNQLISMQPARVMSFPFWGALFCNFGVIFNQIVYYTKIAPGT